MATYGGVKIPEPLRAIEETFCLDANCINARGQMPNISRLECWAELGVIRLAMSRTAHGEASIGNSDRRDKAFEYS